ncbi:zinc finger and scan domain-containing [Holotrichia oblita]|uniref:Zinc finger and scan domain-containing n=1 Tax=Holotrichia oblita TaxID=644536 RepID=A0ACB9TPF6_HOLOL|nr:zinc finger and scan domain-containing [Holotrichia oblita]
MPIFDPIKPRHFSILIMACASVQVIEGDGLPPYICHRCISRLNIAYQFKSQCESSDAKMRQCFDNLQHMPPTPDLTGFIQIKKDNFEQTCESEENGVKFTTTQITPVDEAQQVVQQACENTEDKTESLESSHMHVLQSVQLDPGTSLQNTAKTNTLPDLKLELNETDDLELKVQDILNSVVNQKPKKQTKPHQCDTCGKVFRTKPGLVHHIRIHTGERPYEVNTEQLDADMEIAKKVKSLKKSQRRRKSKEQKVHQCDTCGKTFNRREYLTQHIRIHTGEKPYRCHLCEKRFINSGHLTTHMRTHTGERPHACTLCPKAFSTRQELHKHTMVHNGERPFLCKMCGKTFGSSSNLYSHLKHHTGEKNFTCEYCSKSFYTKQELKQHLVVHTKEKAFLCEFCNRRFAQIAHLKRHSKLHT